MIPCSQYDYIEIACLYRLAVQITQHSGASISGIAVNTGFNQARQECLVLEENSHRHWIETASIRSMKALRGNPHFTEIHFHHQ